MTLIDRTHVFSETTCTHLGAPCPAMSRMLQALAGALHQARDVTQEDFEICGQSNLDGCARQCPARFFATHERIRVFCDVQAETERRSLDRFADTLLAPQAAAMVADQISDRPCAFGQALPAPQKLGAPETSPAHLS